MAHGLLAGIMTDQPGGPRAERRGAGPMSAGALICGLISGALCLGGLALYLIWIALLARFLPRADRNEKRGKGKKKIDEEVIDVEFEEK
ncbi:MAG: hypothetical protein ACMUHB_00015 [Thermoplasmatota archaeon]